MLTHRTVNPRSHYQSMRTPVLSAAAGAALAVGAVLGIQSIQQTRHGHVSSAAPVQQAAASVGVDGGAGTAANTIAAAVGVSRPQTAASVYLVRTPEEAQALRAWIAQGDFGVPAGGAQGASVILAPSADETAFAQAALQEQSRQASRSSSGSAGTEQSGAALTGTGSSTSGTAAAVTRPGSTTTVYLAHTEEEAHTLRAWIAQGSFGVPAGAPAQAAVILAPSPDEAAFARAAVTEWLSESGATPQVLDARTIR